MNKKVLWLIFFVLVIATIIVSSQSTKLQNKEKSIKDSTELLNQKKEHSKWHSKVDIDPMTNRRTEISWIESMDTLNSDLDGSGTNYDKATLTIQQRRKHDDVILELATNQFLSPINTSVIIRFDDGKPAKYSFIEPLDGSTREIFINQPSRIIEKLKKSQIMIIQSELFEKGTFTFAFRVNHFNTISF